MKINERISDINQSLSYTRDEFGVLGEAVTPRFGLNSAFYLLLANQQFVLCDLFLTWYSLQSYTTTKMADTARLTEPQVRIQNIFRRGVTRENLVVVGGRNPGWNICVTSYTRPQGSSQGGVTTPPTLLLDPPLWGLVMKTWKRGTKGLIASDVSRFRWSLW